jgi:hypothetical protein
LPGVELGANSVLYAAQYLAQKNGSGTCGAYPLEEDASYSEEIAKAERMRMGAAVVQSIVHIPEVVGSNPPCVRTMGASPVWCM